MSRASAHIEQTGSAKVLSKRIQQRLIRLGGYVREPCVVSSGSLAPAGMLKFLEGWLGHFVPPSKQRTAAYARNNTHASAIARSGIQA